MTMQLNLYKSRMSIILVGEIVRKRVSRLRIPLERLSSEELEEVKQMGGRYMIVIADDPCLTCGHKIRLQHVEKTDGKRELVQECLYCLCKHHTYANRKGR